MKTQIIPNNQIIIYQTKNGALELKTDSQFETIWLTQQQVAELFDIQKAAISKHVNHIFHSNELDRKSTVSKMETVQMEGKRSGAYAFVWFLKQAKILDVTKITPPALTALTLLIAESAPKDKEKVIGLICTVLIKNKTRRHQ